MGIEGDGAVGMEVFKTRRPMPCSRQKDTTRATFAERNPRATGVRLLPTHVAALSLAFLLSYIFNEDGAQPPPISSREFSQRVNYKDRRARKIFTSILLSRRSSDRAILPSPHPHPPHLVTNRILGADFHWTHFCHVNSFVTQRTFEIHEKYPDVI